MILNPKISENLHLYMRSCEPNRIKPVIYFHIGRESNPATGSGNPRRSCGRRDLPATWRVLIHGVGQVQNAQPFQFLEK